MSADTGLKIHSNGEYSPIDMVKSNIKTFRSRADAHRADAERSMRNADECDRRAVEWEIALEKLL